MARPVQKFAAALAIASVLFLAFPAPATADAQAVAHLSLVEGALSVRHANATLNTPVFAGDEITTSAARGELQLDEATFVRLAPNTSVTVVDLSAGKRALRLEVGTIELRIIADPPDAQILTPAATLVAETAGAYRISLSGGEASIAVRAGRASIPLASGGELTLLEGMHFGKAQAPDDFDGWNDARDVALKQSLSDYHVSPILAANALNGFGRWMNYQSYGLAWLPYQTPGWAPYTLGSWMQTADFGPAWVSSEPWGWAPYHYGRWIYDQSYGWLWIPGDAVAWAPALVGFLALLVPNPWGLSPFGQYIGWVPLAPGEIAPIGLVTNSGYINVGRLYNRPNINFAATPHLRFVQSSVVGAPAHYAPPVHMTSPVAAGGVHAAPVVAPVVHVEPARATVTTSARR